MWAIWKERNSRCFQGQFSPSYVVISMPRFMAASWVSILQEFWGLPIDTILLKWREYTGSFSCGDSKRSDSPDAILATKKRKTCLEEENGEDIKREYCKEAGISGASGEIREGTTVSSTDADVDAESGGSLSLVKLTRSGLLLFTFPRNGCLDTINILSNIFESLSSGGLKSPLWCHRILPIQATCCLKEKDLQVTVSRLVRQYLDDERNKVERPIRFAVGYNRRGIDEKAEMKTKKNTSCDSKEISLLDRNQCFSIVAGAFHEVAADSVVDLKSPELAVLVELLPISGVPIGSSVVAISVLPCNLFTTKPRLCVKALAADAKTAKGRS